MCRALVAMPERRLHTRGVQLLTHVRTYLAISSERLSEIHYLKSELCCFQTVVGFYSPQRFALAPLSSVNLELRVALR